MADPTFLDALRNAQSYLEANISNETAPTVRLHVSGEAAHDVLWFSYIPERGLSVIEAIVSKPNGPSLCTIAVTSLRAVEHPNPTIIVPSAKADEAKRIANELADTAGSFAYEIDRAYLERSLLETYRPYISQQDWIELCHASSSLAA